MWGSRLGVDLVTAGAACAFLAVAHVSAAQSTSETPQAAAVRLCSSCHSMQVVLDTPRGYDAWHDTVQRMIDRGARGTPDEFAQVMQYLFETVTTVDVNHGDDEELMTVLHTSAAAARSIVDRRTKRPFTDLADLEAAVPALDHKLLQAKKNMIVFRK
jgi:hypothetical protein